MVLELTKGQQTLILSAYMPTGLDHRSAHSDAAQWAHELYAEAVKWATGVHQVLLVGDLNETLTPFDRFPARASSTLSSASAAPQPIQCLPAEGFIDVYRALHANARHTPGFTHVYDSATRSIRSRIDYIWVRGFATDALLSVHIDTKLNRLHSHHHLLWLEVRPAAAHPSPGDADGAAIHQLRIPNLRALSQESSRHLWIASACNWRSINMS